MAKSRLNRPIVEVEKPVAPKTKRAIEYDLLTEEDKTRIRAEAQAKIDERAKLAAEKAYYEAQVEELERSRYPEIFEEKFDITLDLALYAQFVSLNGKRYYHGVKYTVPRSTYQTLKEQEQWTQRHEASLKSGDDYNTFYRRERALNTVKNDPNAIQLSGRGGATAAGQPIALRTHF
jgi:hypothetical protein